MLTIPNVIYVKCYLFQMLTIPNVIYAKCYLDEILPLRKCTIGNVTDPCKDIFLILFDDFTFVPLGVRIQQIIFFLP